MWSRKNILGHIRRCLAWKNRSDLVPTSRRGHCTLHPLSLPPVSLFLHHLLLTHVHHTAKQLHTYGWTIRVRAPRAGFLSPSDRPFKPFISLATCTRMNLYPGVACLREPALSPSWPNFFTHDALSARTIDLSHMNSIQTESMMFRRLDNHTYNLHLECSNYYFVRNNE